MKVKFIKGDTVDAVESKCNRFIEENAISVVSISIAAVFTSYGAISVWVASLLYNE